MPNSVPQVTEYKKGKTDCNVSVIFTTVSLLIKRFSITLNFDKPTLNRKIGSHQSLLNYLNNDDTSKNSEDISR